MPYVLALDQGTTSSRAILFDRDGRIHAVAQQEFEQHFPRSGWVEHDATEIWSTQNAVMAEVLANGAASAGDVAAVGITNQRETTVVWDRATGEPVHRAIVWQDRRTAPDCDRLRADGHEDTFFRKTGLVLDAYFSGTKVAWILDHVAGARERAAQGELLFGTIDSWLAFRLTGGARHITDVSNASRTLLFNIHERDWDDELLGILNVPRAMLPEVCESSGDLGVVADGMPAAGAPLSGIVGDQQGATFGQVCIEPGMAKNTYGTGCFLLLNTGSKPKVSSHKLLTTIGWSREGEVHYALEGGVFVGGAIVQWLRDGLKIIQSSSEVEALASSVEDNGGVYLVPALAGLGAPHWDPYARGTMVGLTRGTTTGHIARAALEGIAYQVTDLVRTMEEDAEQPMTELRVDGGAAANNLLLQFQADLLQIPVVRPTVLETTALGAAYLAGLAVGYWDSMDEIANNWKVDRRFEPARSESETAVLLERWHEAVQRSRGWDRGDGS